MYNSQYYTCEQIDQRLLQGYVDDYNYANGTHLTKDQFLNELHKSFNQPDDPSGVKSGIVYMDGEHGTVSYLDYTWASEIHNLKAGDSLIIFPYDATSLEIGFAEVTEEGDVIEILLTGKNTFMAPRDIRVSVGIQKDRYLGYYNYVIVKHDFRTGVDALINSNSVLFNSKQSIPEVQQAQARQNIGIYGEEFGNDKEYNPAKFSGLGKVYLKKNVVEVGDVEKNILTQSAFYKDGTQTPNTDTVFVIQYDFDLNGKTINVPANSILEFDGGSLGNGALKGNCNIISAPDDFYNKVNCMNLYVENERHLAIGDVTDIYDAAYADYSIRKASIDQLITSSYYYSIESDDNIVCRMPDNVLGNTTPFVKYSFYDNNLLLIYETSWSTPAFNQDIIIPENASYVRFKISNKNKSTQGTVTDVLGKTYFSFLDNSRVFVDDDFKLSNDILNIDTSIISGGHIAVRTVDENTEWYYAIFGRTLEDEHGITRQIGAIYIPYSMFKGYDMLEIKRGGLNEVAGNPIIDFLKTAPKINGETVEYSDYYKKRVEISLPPNDTTNFVIPKDCKAIYIYSAYSWNNTAYYVCPKSIRLRKFSSYNLDDLHTTNIEDASQRNVNIGELKFLHWNIGHNNLGRYTGDIYYLTDENAEEHINATKAFLKKVEDNVILFNEWDDKIAIGTSYEDHFSSVLPSTRYGYKRIPSMHLCELGVCFKNQIIGAKLGHFESCKGTVNSGGHPQYSYGYVIYKCYVNSASVYVMQTHLPAGYSAENLQAVYAEMIEVTKSYPGVVIVGDFNDIGRYNAQSNPTGNRFYNLEQIFKEEDGWHIANKELDNTPTMDWSRGRGHVTDILDFVVWRGNYIDVPYFKVRTDAIIPGSEALAETEGRNIDFDPSGNTNWNESYINHRLSDHWPIEFKVVANYDINLTPATRGNNRYDFTTDTPQWHDGEKWTDANGEIAGIRRIGTTEQRPLPKNVGFVYYDTSINDFVIWNGKKWVKNSSVPDSFGVITAEDENKVEGFYTLAASNSEETDMFNVIK